MIKFNKMGRELIASIEGSDITATIVEESKGITSVQLLCKLLNNTQPVEVGDRVLMKLVTDGIRTFFKDQVSLEISPEGIFEFSTIEWSAKAKDGKGTPWQLHTYISAKKEGNAELKVFVEGTYTNTINLTTKINSDKDVFGKKAIDRLIAENKYIQPFADAYSPREYTENYCMAAAERGLSEDRKSVV